VFELYLDELYDLENDPTESNNLYQENPETVNKMLKLLEVKK